MFGVRLRQIRKGKGLTLEELARMYNNKFDAGLNKGTLSKYENGKQEPMISVVDNLATILNVPTDYLLGRLTFPEINKADSPRKEIHRELPLTENEEQLIADYRKLNEEGKQKALEAVEMYTMIAMYCDKGEVPNE